MPVLQLTSEVFLLSKRNTSGTRELEYRGVGEINYFCSSLSGFYAKLTSRVIDEALEYNVK